MTRITAIQLFEPPNPPNPPPEQGLQQGLKQELKLGCWHQLFEFPNP